MWISVKQPLLLYILSDKIMMFLFVEKDTLKFLIHRLWKRCG
jgi:hypothetical protein